MLKCHLFFKKVPSVGVDLVAIFTLDSVRGKGSKEISLDIDDLVFFEGLFWSFFFTIYFPYVLATMLWDL